MIPKIIHFCWYGSSYLPPRYARCVDTWKTHLKDYEIRQWHDKNTDFDTPFLKDALRRKNWAFIADYIRMRVIHRHGGVYLDADTEVIRSLDPLLNNQCFIANEAKERPTTGVIGSIEGHPFPLNCMKIIDERFKQKLPYLIAPDVAALALKQAKANEVTIYSEKYFYPYNPLDPDRPSYGLMFSDITNETYAIHHWAKGWSEKGKDALEVRFKRMFNRISGRATSGL